MSLAGGMPNLAALPLDALAGEVADLVARDGQVALQYGSAQGAPGAARADLRGDGAGGHPRRSGRRRRHRRLADGAGPRHAHLLRPRRCRARRGSVLRRRARAASPPTRRGWCTSRWTRDGLVPDAAARRARARWQAGDRAEVPLHGPDLPQPGGRHALRRAAGRGARDLPRVRRRRRRGQPLRAAGLQRAHLPRAALARPRRRLPGLVLQDVRGRACGSAGRSCRPPCATGWCSPPNRRPCARRVSPRCWSRATWRHHDWRSQIKTYTEAYRDRRDAMLRALETYLPDGCTWNVPDGGFYVWLTVPGGRRHEGDAAARGHGAGRLRVGHRLLRRRARQPPAAAVVLLPVAGADHRRASAGWPACWRRSSTCCTRSAARPGPPSVRRRRRRHPCARRHAGGRRTVAHAARTAAAYRCERVLCWPAASRTSARCRCARARLAAALRGVGLDVREWDVDAALVDRLRHRPARRRRDRAARRRGRERLGAGGAGAARRAVRRHRRRAPADGRGTSRPRRPSSPGRASTPRTGSRCRTRRSVRSARRRCSTRWSTGSACR